MQRAALIAVFGLAMTSVAFAFYLGPEFDVVPVSGTYSVSNLLTGAGLVTAGVVLGIVAILLYWKAFRALRSMSRKFTTPARYAPLALLGIAGAVAAIDGAVFYLIEAINCSGAGNPVKADCVNSGAIGLESLLVVSVLLLLVGGVAILVGFWRLGDRYRSPIFKVGAVLEIFPYIGFIGALCVFLGATGVRRERGPVEVARPSKDEDEEDDDDGDDNEDNDEDDDRSR